MRSIFLKLFVIQNKEFLYLVQGSMLVAEYERKFTNLSKYAIGIVIDEVNRCKRFVEGLRKEIRTPVTATTVWDVFSKLVEAAMRAEVSLKEQVAEEEEDTMRREEIESRRYTSRNITIKTFELRMEQVKPGGIIIPKPIKRPGCMDC